jgi:hypothetical protein
VEKPWISGEKSHFDIADNPVEILRIARGIQEEDRWKKPPAAMPGATA